MHDEAGHAACVDDWLERAGTGLPPTALLNLFERALSAIWVRTETTLGEVTLGAIAERVLLNASEKFPHFAALKVEPGGGIQLGGLREQVRAGQDLLLRPGIRCVLAELLTVLGNLTAEILTPELHAALSSVTVDTAGEDPTS